MARQYAGDDQEMYRAVVTTTSVVDGREPRVYSEVLGPYNSKGVAKAMVTWTKNDADRTTRYSDNEVRTVEGHVEKANVTWERV